MIQAHGILAGGCGGGDAWPVPVEAVVVLKQQHGNPAGAVGRGDFIRDPACGRERSQPSGACPTIAERGSHLDPPAAAVSSTGPGTTVPQQQLSQRHPLLAPG